MTDCDLIVVGAGTAGCLLASELARRTSWNVVLLEPASESAAAIDRIRPSRWLNLLRSSEDWDLGIESSPRMAGRVLRWPRGRGLGGSGRINAMIWFPPTRGDLEDLSRASGGDWSLAALSNSFQHAQSLVCPESPRWISESSQRFLATLGHWDRAQPMIYQRVNRQGRRWTPAELLCNSSEHGQSPGRLQIVRGSVDRVLFSDDTAVGVQIRDKASSQQIHSRAGVVLCAGTIGTPTILAHSGIGPQDDLRDVSIELRVDSPHVGGGLQDHLLMPVIFRLPPYERFRERHSPRDLARWQTVGQGPVASNIAECGGFLEDGKFQIHVTPTDYLTFPQANARAAMTLGVNLTQPVSRGRLAVRSSDPQQPATIEAGYLSAEADLQATIQGVRLCREIANTGPLAQWHRGELLPGAKRDEDEALARSIARYAQTLYHPVGTCRMGDQSDSVVDPQLRVRGVEKLWVVDASVLPQISRGNPNATVMMVANHWVEMVVARQSQP